MWVMFHTYHHPMLESLLLMTCKDQIYFSCSKLVQVQGVRAPFNFIVFLILVCQLPFRFKFESYLCNLFFIYIYFFICYHTSIYMLPLVNQVLDKPRLMEGQGTKMNASMGCRYGPKSQAIYISKVTNMGFQLSSCDKRRRLGKSCVVQMALRIGNQRRLRHIITIIPNLNPFPISSFSYYNIQSLMPILTNYTRFILLPFFFFLFIFFHSHFFLFFFFINYNKEHRFKLNPRQYFLHLYIPSH